MGDGSVSIFRRAAGQRYFQEAFVLKNPGYHLDEFIVIASANLLEFFALAGCIQMQSDLQANVNVREDVACDK